MSQFNAGLVSGATVEWETPQELFDYWNGIFNFGLDAAASHDNRKCETFYTKDDDALTKDWASPLYTRRVWLNPPYGKGIELWIRKAADESARGALVVCLVKYATDTVWWDVIEEARATVVPLKGRVRHGGSGSAPFPSAIVIFWPGPGRKHRA